MRRPRRPSRHLDRGQATVEVALILPVVLVIVLAVAQVAMVWRAQLLVTHAARDAARTGVVTGDPASIVASARGSTALDPARLRVEIVRRDRPGGLVTVELTWGPIDTVPVIGAVIGDRYVTATATMRVES